MKVTPNFNFNGHCEEAIELYKRAFNARVGCFLRYSNAKSADFDKELSEVQKKYIYHAELFIGTQRIMMCDNMDVPFQSSLSLSLVVTMDTKEEVRKAYEVLKEGVTIIYPIHSTTYSSCEVALIDKFGFRWGIMTEL
ncbi:MAG: VOC family protein [bacterium]|nr:VOC family protein [bacterium]